MVFILREKFSKWRKLIYQKIREKEHLRTGSFSSMTGFPVNGQVTFRRLHSVLVITMSSSSSPGRGCPVWWTFCIKQWKTQEWRTIYCQNSKSFTVQQVEIPCLSEAREFLLKWSWLQLKDGNGERERERIKCEDLKHHDLKLVFGAFTDCSWQRKNNRMYWNNKHCYCLLILSSESTGCKLRLFGKSHTYVKNAWSTVWYLHTTKYGFGISNTAF